MGENTLNFVYTEPHKNERPKDVTNEGSFYTF